MRKKLCWNENFYEHYDYKKSKEPGVCFECQLSVIRYQQLVDLQ